MLKRTDKEQIVEDLGKLFEESNNIFITDYLGLDVEQITKLRKDLRDNNISYRVAKNTLFRIAAKNRGYENLLEFFEGPTAIAFGADDPTVPAKAIYEFSKKNEKPEVKAFYADGVLYDKNELKALAEIPSRDELIAKIVGAVGAPLSNLVGTFDGLLRELCVTIDQIAEQKGN